MSGPTDVSAREGLRWNDYANPLLQEAPWISAPCSPLFLNARLHASWHQRNSWSASSRELIHRVGGIGLGTPARRPPQHRLARRRMLCCVVRSVAAGRRWLDGAREDHMRTHVREGKRFRLSAQMVALLEENNALAGNLAPASAAGSNIPSDLGSQRSDFRCRGVRLCRHFSPKSEP